MKMKPIIFSLTIIGFSITICEIAAFLKGDELKAMIGGRISLISYASGHGLVLSGDGKLARSVHTLVWTGYYDGTKVAIKLIRSESDFNQELEMYQALNATEDPSIEQKGIPKVYCHGSFDSLRKRKVYFIAMTLFEGTLETRFMRYGKNISDLSLSLIFKRSVEILEYIHIKNVVHNDIKPANIFLLGSKVFIADFDLSAFRDVFTMHSTPKFASLNFHKRQQRCAIDDLQSLVFSIWDLAGCNSNSYGSDILETINDGKLESEIQEKCRYFNNENIQKVFRSICLEIFEKQVPDYNAINQKLINAITELSEETGQVQFEWLTGA